MENIKGVAFDFDDVLLDTESNLDWLYRSFRKTLAEYGIKDSQENLQKIYSKNLHRFDKVSKEFGIQSEELWETRNKYYIEEKMKAMKNREINSFTDVDSLYKLKETFSLTIMSDSPQKIVDFFIKEFNYEDLFDFGIGIGTNFEDLKKLKPTTYLLDRLRGIVEYDKLIYVGDSEKDCKFAERGGIDFIFLSRKKDERFNSLNKVVNYLLC